MKAGKIITLLFFATFISGCLSGDPVATPSPEVFFAKMSNYWPPDGGFNCLEFVDDRCISRTASGQRWEDWIYRGCACPIEFSFGTVFTIDGKDWTCVDRGSMIIMVDKNTFWLDLLTDNPTYPYGYVVKVEKIDN